MPLTLLEAKASGIPMVSFDIITGPREIIEENKDGFLIEPYNIEKMAQKMDELMNSEELRSNMAKETFRRVNKFDKNSIIKQWEELLDNI